MYTLHREKVWAPIHICSNYSKIPIVVSKNKESTKQLLKSRNKKETF